MRVMAVTDYAQPLELAGRVRLYSSGGCPSYVLLPIIARGRGAP